MKDHIQEASLIDLTDDDLKEIIGSTYTRLRNLEEQRKGDPTVLRLHEELHKHVEEHYGVHIRTCKARLKAARYVANSRGIVWRDLANVEKE